MNKLDFLFDKLSKSYSILSDKTLLSERDYLFTLKATLEAKADIMQGEICKLSAKLQILKASCESLDQKYRNNVLEYENLKTALDNYKSELNYLKKEEALVKRKNFQLNTENLGLKSLVRIAKAQENSE
ncbi:DgyrCDS6722 [Dimorphilus gyrociliatus]|uniref:DgyrCDS6722 n=1 Tax=Dimorphilus gyrociliatus TaxID=2664684 RepID=A0A7I8VNV8_9ANNE|nr:DgyrCDS6722 [Dimorphilus gyrociliatus]